MRRDMKTVGELTQKDLGKIVRVRKQEGKLASLWYNHDYNITFNDGETEPETDTNENIYLAFYDPDRPSVAGEYFTVRETDEVEFQVTGYSEVSTKDGTAKINDKVYVSEQQAEEESIYVGSKIGKVQFWA